MYVGKTVSYDFHSIIFSLFLNPAVMMDERFWTSLRKIVISLEEDDAFKSWIGAIEEEETEQEYNGEEGKERKSIWRPVAYRHKSRAQVS